MHGVLGFENIGRRLQEVARLAKETLKRSVLGYGWLRL